MEQLTKTLLDVKADEHDFFQKVKGRVCIPASPNPRWMKDVLRSTKEEIAATIDFVQNGTHFGFENVAKASFDHLDGLKATEKHFEMAINGYPNLLDIEFLQWRKKDTSFPVFMVMGLDSPEFSISVTSGWEQSTAIFRPNLPYEIQAQFQETVNQLFEIAKGNKRNSNPSGSTATISAEFTGSPPAETRKRIVNATASKLFRGVYIVAEAPKWVVNVTVPARTDPLVVGSVPYETPSGRVVTQFYLIDTFDPTSLEQVVAEEYAFKPIKPSHS